MTHIKICGIKEVSHALEVAGAGVDFIGLVFASSPRQVTPAQAEKIVSALKKSKATTETVGVFVNTPASKVKKIVEYYILGFCQEQRRNINLSSFQDPYFFPREQL